MNNLDQNHLQIPVFPALAAPIANAARWANSLFAPVCLIMLDVRQIVALNAQSTRNVPRIWLVLMNAVKILVPVLVASMHNVMWLVILLFVPVTLDTPVIHFLAAIP